MEEGYSGEWLVREEVENGEPVESQRSTAFLSAHSENKNLALCKILSILSESL